MYTGKGNGILGTVLVAGVAYFGIAWFLNNRRKSMPPMIIGEPRFAQPMMY